MTTGIASPQSTALSEAKRPCRQPAKISLHKAMNRFFDRDDSELKRSTRTEYEHALLLLEEYINSFGSVLLGASDTLPTFARPKNGPVSKRYNTDSVAKLFRGFVLFFLRFKVNAPNEIKLTLVKIIEEFVCLSGVLCDANFECMISPLASNGESCADKKQVTNSQ